MDRTARFICHNCRAHLLRQPRHAQSPCRRQYATTTTSQPLRLGIVGSGPAGFYAALRVLQRLPDARVDMYERLPVPFGLVRYGVAPDHPEVKNCQDRFDDVAASPRFTFVGNTAVGHAVPLAALRRHYDALLFAYGASEDRPLGIPGEHLRGVQSARAFVGWYNGLPEFAHLQPDLDADAALVVGNGNVALDVARILLTPVDALRRTDISDAALALLSTSRVRAVTIAGRRGPRQASFTIKEVRELVSLPDTAFSTSRPDLLPSREYIQSLPKLEQRSFRLVQLLRDSIATSGSKRCALLSMASPTAFHGNDSGHLESTSFTTTAFDDPAHSHSPSARVHIDPHAPAISIRARLAFRSIGYRAHALPDMARALDIDFAPHAGIIQNDGLGRALSLANLVADPAAAPLAKGIRRGVYCAGWVKTGPTGVIASTMNDAFATADALVADWTADVPFLNGRPSTASRLPDGAGWAAVREETGYRDAVSWAQWRAIDAVEKARGAHAGRPRAKVLDVRDMLEIALG